MFKIRSTTIHVYLYIHECASTLVELLVRAAWVFSEIEILVQYSSMIVDPILGRFYFRPLISGVIRWVLHPKGFMSVLLRCAQNRPEIGAA